MVRRRGRRKGTRMRWKGPRVWWRDEADLDRAGRDETNPARARCGLPSSGTSFSIASASPIAGSGYMAATWTRRNDRRRC